MTSRDEALRALADWCNDRQVHWAAQEGDYAQGRVNAFCEAEYEIRQQIAILATASEQAPVACERDDALEYAEEQSMLDDDAVEVIVCELGDYGPVDREMVTVLFDDMKIAECYRAEDAEYVAAALREYSSPAHTSEARDAVVTDEMVERAMNARIPGGSQAWVWLFNCAGGMAPEERHRDFFRRVLDAAMRQEAGSRE